MTRQDIEKRIVELKAKQSEHFKQKKSFRNADDLEAIRTELNDLKAKAGDIYRNKKSAEA